MGIEGMYASLMGSERPINMFSGDTALVTLIATSVFLPHKKIISYQWKISSWVLFLILSSTKNHIISYHRKKNASKFYDRFNVSKCLEYCRCIHGVISILSNGVKRSTFNGGHIWFHCRFFWQTLILLSLATIID